MNVQHTSLIPVIWDESITYEKLMYAYLGSSFLMIRHWLSMRYCELHTDRDGQNHHMLMILKSKSIHLNKGDLKLKSKSLWKWWFENQNHIENQMIFKF